ncbi:aminodeoxychorismate/anthranilate synthase component II [Fructobacillus sp. CRL 2054]|uniref:anthranilate synthase component II n=1 Tax=Fructobacillus sp. CRL 2054 TaxID=2763007 RepID=UPI002379E8A2|nr:aminodeoxychorismate/anthranilate synthase component II [Fructobacillus sp. CRL 2054]MDD9138735.1 aminodeoxychorismate/anthranilate synthase component II [Fructobacillus sp. CRL 2054]
MLLLIDNYDSFTYNLYQEIGKLTEQEIRVVKNDQVTEADLNNPEVTGLILSPGPGSPEKAGRMNEMLEKAIGQMPVLGICLGHQAIGQVYGGKISLAPLMHGRTSMVTVESKDGQTSGIFADCPEEFVVGRYHSLMIDPETLPDNLAVTATAADGTIQAVADEENRVYGLEFHPESIMTDQVVAKQIFENFIQMTERTK